MAAMRGKLSSFVRANVTVYEFVEDIPATASHVSRDLFGSQSLSLSRFKASHTTAGVFAQLVVVLFLRSRAFA